MPHKVNVLTSEPEKLYIQGEKQLLKITPESIEQAVNALPSEVPAEWRTAFRRVLEHPPAAAVDELVTDGMELPYCGGIIVISTPGHTPGHFSLYHKPSRTLIAGDAMIVENDQLQRPNPKYCTDPQLALQSLRKLVRYEIEAVICYHGGIYTGDVNKRILELIGNEQTG